jgi:hypothetical protein
MQHGMTKDHIIGPSFFQKATMKSCSFLNMLEHYTFPEFPCDALFQQDEVWHNLEN